MTFSPFAFFLLHENTLFRNFCAESDTMLTKVPPGRWHVLLTPPGGHFLTFPPLSQYSTCDKSNFCYALCSRFSLQIISCSISSSIKDKKRQGRQCLSRARQDPRIRRHIGIVAVDERTVVRTCPAALTQQWTSLLGVPCVDPKLSPCRRRVVHRHENENGGSRHRSTQVQWTNPN